MGYFCGIGFGDRVRGTIGDAGSAANS